MGTAERVIKYSAIFGALVLFSHGGAEDIKYSAGFVRLPAFFSMRAGKDGALLRTRTEKCYFCGHTAVRNRAVS